MTLLANTAKVLYAEFPFGSDLKNPRNPNVLSTRGNYVSGSRITQRKQASLVAPEVQFHTDWANAIRRGVRERYRGVRKLRPLNIPISSTRVMNLSYCFRSKPRNSCSLYPLHIVTFHQSTSKISSANSDDLLVDTFYLQESNDLYEGYDEPTVVSGRDEMTGFRKVPRRRRPIDVRGGNEKPWGGDEEEGMFWEREKF